MRLWLHIAAFLASVPVWTGAALACEPLPPQPLWADKRIKVEGNCAFTQAEGHYDTSIWGNKAIDIGGGKVGQKVNEAAVCRVYERLVVVDCNAGQGIFVEGVVDPQDNVDLGGGPSTSIAVIQHPKGPIRLTSTTTISDIAAVAQRAGLTYTTDLTQDLSRMKKRNRYNPYCGCAVFYPGSTGANK
ncbi:MAG: hypothetical protein AB3N23_09355 [Paracoccaceae bacterium]